MITDPSRVKVSDPGHPDVCNVYSYYQIFSNAAKVKDVHAWCTTAQKGCTDCKKELAGFVNDRLSAIRAERQRLEKNKDYVQDIIRQGYTRASEVAKATMNEVKDLLHLVR